MIRDYSADDSYPNSDSTLEIEACADVVEMSIGNESSWRQLALSMPDAIRLRDYLIDITRYRR